MTTNSQKIKLSNFTKSLLIATLSGAFTLTTVFVTSYIGIRQTRESDKKILLERKIDLLDKTTKIFYKLPGIQEMMAYKIHNNFDTFLVNPLDHQLEIVPKNYFISKDAAELRAEYFSILVQDQLYFGPKTKAFIIDSISNGAMKDKLSWWDTPDSLGQRLTEIMASELTN